VDKIVHKAGVKTATRWFNVKEFFSSQILFITGFSYLMPGVSHERPPIRALYLSNI